MEIAVQTISYDKTVWSNVWSKKEDLKDFNSQFLVPQVRKGEQLIFLKPAIEKAFDLMGDDIVELSTKNEFLKKIII